MVYFASLLAFEATFSGMITRSLFAAYEKNVTLHLILLLLLLVRLPSIR